MIFEDSYRVQLNINESKGSVRIHGIVMRLISKAAQGLVQTRAAIPGGIRIVGNGGSPFTETIFARKFI